MCLSAIKNVKFLVFNILARNKQKRRTHTQWTEARCANIRSLLHSLRSTKVLCYWYRCCSCCVCVYFFCSLLYFFFRVVSWDVLDIFASAKRNPFVPMVSRKANKTKLTWQIGSAVHCAARHSFRGHICGQNGCNIHIFFGADESVFITRTRRQFKGNICTYEYR